jgi:glycosyltransferase involved in cell wall biosynthesis
VKIALVSDAWTPQVNGVVRTLGMVTRELTAAGHQVVPITPDRFVTVPCPTYPEIRLAVRPGGRARKMLREAAPDAIHIATEGPLGVAVRGLCLEEGWHFTTAYHTRFPEYIQSRFAVPASWCYAMLRRFHRPSSGVMVATDSIRNDLAERDFLDLPRPIFLSVGRLAVEKNLEAFLALDLPGSKLVVGDGPLLPQLRRRYPSAHFAGNQTGDALTAHYAAADVFVFPSRTDTFGLVLLEALASGVPVAAFPVPGPLDVVGGSDVGVLDEDLRAAALAALTIPRERCREYALAYTWAHCATQFLQSLAPLQ